MSWRGDHRTHPCLHGLAHQRAVVRPTLRVGVDVEVILTRHCIFLMDILKITNGIYRVVPE
jgi:hypothetical protein